MTLISADPTIPLTPAARAAYQELRDLNEIAIQNTTNPGILQGLNDAQLDLDDILTKDDLYRIHATTALYEALVDQIKSTNQRLDDLREKIKAISDDIATAADIIAAIDKVLAIVPTL